MFSNEYIPLYFYSTVFQGNMALIGITAIFAIFRLQSLCTEANELFRQMKDRIVQPTLKQIPAGEFAKYLQNATTGKALLKVLTDWKDDQSGGFNQNYLKSHALTILGDASFFELAAHEQARRDQHNIFVEKLVAPLYWTVGMCIGSLILLLFGHDVHSTVGWLSVLLMVCTIACQYVTLRKIVKYGLTTLVEPQKKSD